jgi:general L-amino acid transport system permease protein
MKMTTMTDPPKASFRLSQLIYDTRYRSLTIQVIAMILLMLAFSWLISNTIANLQALGKTFDFRFLGQRAGYDINQMLIPYDSSNTHARAALVGILNTLLIAALGCVLATILGVIAGVLRLSKNWIVARLMTVYIEGFRNIPLLLWILVIFALMTEATPQPRDFREGGTASMILWDSVAISNRGVFIPMPQWGAGSQALVVIFLLALVAAWGWRRYALKTLFDTGRLLPILWPMLAIVVIFPVVAYFLLGRPVTLSYPVLGGFNFEGGLQIRNSLLALWLALSLYTGAFIAENVRGGILAVSHGQTEAAFALGMRPNRTMNLVILPQAMRVIIPPLISQYLNLTKNSSLAIAVGYMDVRSTLGGITINQTGRELEGMLLLGLFYLVLSLLISGVMNIYNSRMKLKER